MYEAICSECLNRFIVPLGQAIHTNGLCPMCVTKGLSHKPPAKRNTSERDELAKEIFKLLTVDLSKAAMENPTAAANFRSIMEANCRTAFLHADIYMEQKSKCPNKSQSN